jgi:serine/threonine protein phosphatase PrpC
MSSSFPLDGMRVRFAGDSNVGMKRAHNEDSFYLPESERLAIVADGMGGHASGEVASRMAVDTIVGFFKATQDDQQLTWPFKMDHGHRYDVNRMVTAIKLANLKIHEQAQKDPRCHGMGTTVVSTLFLDRALIVGHVGDSRLYRRRDGVMKQLTEDHSLLNDYIKMKNLSPDEIAAFPHKNVIVRALGMKDTVQVDVHVDKPELGDLYIICSAPPTRTVASTTSRSSPCASRKPSSRRQHSVRPRMTMRRGDRSGAQRFRFSDSRHASPSRTSPAQVSTGS